MLNILSHHSCLWLVASYGESLLSQVTLTSDVNNLSPKKKRLLYKRRFFYIRNAFLPMSNLFNTVISGLSAYCIKLSR